MKFPNVKKLVDGALSLIKGVELSKEVFDLMVNTAGSVLKGDVDSAGQYARRAALRHAFDEAQKLKRGERP